jgi:hypothetical protein
MSFDRGGVVRCGLVQLVSIAGRPNLKKFLTGSKCVKYAVLNLWLNSVTLEFEGNATMAVMSLDQTIGFENVKHHQPMPLNLFLL